MPESSIVIFSKFISTLLETFRTSLSAIGWPSFSLGSGCCVSMMILSTEPSLMGLCQAPNRQSINQQSSLPCIRTGSLPARLSWTSLLGSEVWGPFCSPTLPRDIKKMADVQIAFFRQLCRLKRSVTPAIIFRELSEMPWVHRWWNQVIGFMHRLSNMPEDSIHAEILRDNIADAQEHPSYGNWAGGIVKQYSRLGMVSPFSSPGITCLNSLGFQANM